MEYSDADYAEYALTFKALSDETRLKIIDMLSRGELCACEILKAFNISQSTLSYHLKILVDSGLVNGVREGAWMRYTLRKENFEAVQAFIAHITTDKEEVICQNVKLELGDIRALNELKMLDTIGCCSSHPQKRIVIDFLYLDLSICERCQGTEANLDGAVDEVANLLKAVGYEITVNKVNITSKELAVKYEFLSSPTLRINGNDIDLDVKESACTECGDLCGDSVDCRVWTYEGMEYTTPPKALIINSILKEIYGGSKPKASKSEYILPRNLEVFFEGIETKENTDEL